MKCCRRSTTWCASALALLAVLTLPPPVFADGVEAAVRRAIATAVIERVGTGIDVTVEKVIVSGRVGSIDLVAVPAPGARTGQPSVFSLSAPAKRAGSRQRVGSALATVHVSGSHTRTARSIVRGTILSGDDLVSTVGPIVDVPFSPLAGSDTLVGARLSRDLSAGAVVTSAAVQLVPLVRGGDVVTVRTRIGGVLAEGRAVASESGADGDTIRLVNPESRRTLHGRVVGRGEVEVIHES